MANASLVTSPSKKLAFFTIFSIFKWIVFYNTQNLFCKVRQLLRKRGSADVSVIKTFLTTKLKLNSCAIEVFQCTENNRLFSVRDVTSRRLFVKTIKNLDLCLTKPACCRLWSDSTSQPSIAVKLSAFCDRSVDDNPSFFVSFETRKSDNRTKTSWAQTRKWVDSCSSISVERLVILIAQRCRVHQRTLAVGGSITVRLVSSFTRLH